MYEVHFQMHHRPFPPTADVTTYVPVGSVEEAGQTLLRVVQRGSGPALVIGAAGTGKSMLCLLLAEHFASQMQVALLATGQLANPKALYQAILFELGLPYRDMDENELRLSLIEFLTDEERCQGLLLVVDEAHVLPLRILEEIRMLTNVVREGAARVHLVLAGGAALEERFTSPKLDSFNQRLAARCYLEHLNREETASYVREQVVASGGNAETAFNAQALSAVFDATDGIPRLVNQLCDHALIMAALGGHSSVTSEIVQEAWADLQQLPTPWAEPAKATGQHVIEFGELDEEEPVASVPFSTGEVADSTQQMPLETNEETYLQEPAAESRLAEIESHIAAVDELLDDAAEEETGFEHAAEPEPVMADNPFEEAFEEETTVVDSYASLQETRMINAPRVHSAEGREIAAILAGAGAGTTPAIENEAFVTTISVTETDDVEQNQLDRTEPEESAADAPETLSLELEVNDSSEDEPIVANVEKQAVTRQVELTEAVASLLHEDDASDDVEEVAVADSSKPTLAPQVQFTLVGSEESATVEAEDDSDLIIVQERDDASTSTTPHLAQGKARRQKYRQLFNRLRQA